MALKGKNAVITGSTSGIGLGIARALAAEGCNIMLNGLPAADCESIRADLAKASGVKVLFDPADMSKTAEVRRLVKRAEDELGSVDVLVNNAGIQHVSPIEDFPEEKLDLIMRINFFSAFHAIAAALPGMKARKWGRIIDITSAHSLVASPFKSAYVSSKHAVMGLTKTVALEVAEAGVTINNIAPGYVWTPLVERQIPDTMAARGLTKEQVISEVLLKAQPTKKFVTIEEVAAAAVFLASDAAASITGTTLSIDGGWTAQ
jgi:3-hydroxybutyrate dehydrogenase